MKLELKLRELQQICFFIKKSYSKIFCSFINLLIFRGAGTRFVIKTGNHVDMTNATSKARYAGCRPQSATLLKKETLAQVFSCEFREMLLRIPFLQNTSGQLLLYHLVNIINITYTHHLRHFISVIKRMKVVFMDYICDYFV